MTVAPWANKGVGVQSTPSPMQLGPLTAADEPPNRNKNELEMGDSGDGLAAKACVTIEILSII